MIKGEFIFLPFILIEKIGNPFLRVAYFILISPLSLIWIIPLMLIDLLIGVILSIWRGEI